MRLYFLLMTYAALVKPFVDMYLRRNKETTDPFMDKEEEEAVKKYFAKPPYNEMSLPQFSDQFPTELTHTPITEEELKEFVSILNVIQFRMLAILAKDYSTTKK